MTLYRVTVERTDRQRNAYYSHSKAKTDVKYYEEDGIRGAVQGFGSRILSIEKLSVTVTADVTRDFL